MRYMQMCFFFFSSRRRHTRFDCDWSSDVCSSDLRQARHQERQKRMSSETHIIDGKAVAATVRAEVRAEADRLRARGVTPGRSEERRVGKECRSRGSPYH